VLVISSATISRSLPNAALRLYLRAAPPTPIFAWPLIPPWRPACPCINAQARITRQLLKRCLRLPGAGKPRVSEISYDQFAFFPE
jgi:hypothetical protein